MKIAILPGDGIGTEIVAQAVRVLQALDLTFEMEEAKVGGAAYEAHGHPLPESTLKLAQAADAVLFGAVGDWKYDTLERSLRPEQAILGLRKHLGLFANFRPALCYPELTHASSLKPELVAGLDILLIRELTGDIYFGQPRGAPRSTGTSPVPRRPSTPCATRAPRSSASPTSPSRRPASAASA
jgi:3-isopropylmalate dehydrogenase